MSTPSPAELSSSSPAAPRRFRWKIGAAILGLAITAQLLLLWRFAEDPTFAKMSVLWVWPAALFALTLWWLFASGVALRIRIASLVVGVVGVGILAALVRVDGSDGDMVPRVIWRWTPTEAEKARAYWKEQAIARAGSTGTVEPTDSQPAAEAIAREPLTAGPEDWPDFRGPQRDGLWRGTPFRTDWETRPPREVWRHPVGLGWSSFAVVGNFAITMEQRDNEESVVCYSLETGEPLWIHGDTTRFEAVEVNGGDGPHATPVIAGDDTITLGATGLLNVLDTRTGKKRWSREILKDAGVDGTPEPNLQWGMSGTPLVTDRHIVVIPGSQHDKGVIAYDRADGKIAWAAGSFPAGYTGARIETLGDQPQLLVFHGAGLAAFAPDSGQSLWSFPWENFAKVNSAQPIRLDNTSLVIGSGYGLGGVRLDVVSNGQAWDIREAWKNNRFKLKFNDALLLDGTIYGLDDGILTALDPETGKTRWKAQRLGYGQLLGQPGALIVLSEEGDVVLVAADPKKYRELGRFHALDGTTWNHPAFAHGKLLVRNGTMAACYDVAE